MVEIMVVVVIVGLLAAIAIPAFKIVQDRSKASFLANNFRIYRAEFEVFALEKGHWPPDANRGVVPQGMEGRLNRFWEESPTGDLWDWEHNAVGVTAGISLVGINTTEDIMLRVARILDDGSLSSGDFRRNGNRYTWILEH